MLGQNHQTPATHIQSSCSPGTLCCLQKAGNNRDWSAFPLWQQREWSWSLARSAEGCAEDNMKKTPPNSSKITQYKQNGLCCVFLQHLISSPCVLTIPLYPPPPQSRWRPRAFSPLGKCPKSHARTQPPSLATVLLYCTSCFPWLVNSMGHHWVLTERLFHLCWPMTSDSRIGAQVKGQSWKGAKGKGTS